MFTDVFMHMKRRPEIEHKILAIAAILVLVAGIVTTNMTNSAFAQVSKDATKMKTMEKTTDVNQR